MKNIYSRLVCTQLILTSNYKNLTTSFYKNYVPPKQIQISPSCGLSSSSRGILQNIYSSLTKSINIPNKTNGAGTEIQFHSYTQRSNKIKSKTRRGGLFSQYLHTKQRYRYNRVIRKAPSICLFDVAVGCLLDAVNNTFQMSRICFL